MSPLDLLVVCQALRDSTALPFGHPRYRAAVESGLHAFGEGDVVDRESDVLLRSLVILLADEPAADSHRLASALVALLARVGRQEYVRRDLAALGFHRIGRIDDVGRRSLWLREEVGAVELRAGREGSDGSARITSEHPLFREISSVLSCARFASEWEEPRGGALEPSYALDRHPASVHREQDVDAAGPTVGVVLDDERMEAISHMLDRGHGHVTEDGCPYVVDRDELTALVKEVVDGRARSRRAAESQRELDAHRNALAVWRILGTDLDERWHRFAMLAAAIARMGDRSSPSVSASIVKAVCLLRGDEDVDWTRDDREVLSRLVTDSSLIPESQISGSRIPREAIRRTLGELVNAVDREVPRGSDPGHGRDPG